MEPITIEQAIAGGLRPLTSPCSKGELWIIENVLSDMRRGGITAAVVTVPGGVEVWRASNGFKEYREDLK